MNAIPATADDILAKLYRRFVVRTTARHRAAKNRHCQEIGFWG
jgi:hypothetical protein